MNAQPADKGKSRADWRKGAAAKATPTRFRQPNTDYTRFLIVGTCAMGIISALAYFIYLGLAVPVPTPLIAIGVSYPETVPPNAYMVEDLEQFRAIAPDVADVVTQQIDAQDNIATQLRKLRIVPGGPTRTRITGHGGVLVFYVSAHGVVNRRGEPCLLLARPDSDEPSTAADQKPGSFDALNCDTWITASELLDRIVRTDPDPDVRKLVVFDTGKILTGWEMGLLVNDFTEKLAEIIPQHPDVVVITAQRDSGEQAWIAPELGHSVFGYFVMRGLSGAANADHDNDISLHELFRYVQHQVQQYVGSLYGVSQTPHMIPSSNDVADFALAYAPAAPPPAPLQENQAKTLLARYQPLQQLWSRVRRLDPSADSPAFNLEPVAWHHVQATLVRADRWFLAGKQYETNWKQAANDTAKVLDRLEQPNQPWLNSPYLPTTNDETTDAIRLNVEQARLKWWQLQDAATATPTPEPTTADAKKPEPPPRFPVRNVTDVTIEHLLATRITLKELVRGIEFVQLSRESDDGRDPPELALLKLVSSYFDHELFQTQPDLSADVLHELLHVYRLSWRAGTPADARIDPLVRPLRDVCDARLRLALDHLFVGGIPTLKIALTELHELASEEGDGYRQVFRLAENASRACAVHDRILSLIPRLAEWAARNDGPVHMSISELLTQFQHFHEHLAQELAYEPDNTASHSVTANGNRELTSVVDTLQVEAQHIDAEFHKCIETISMHAAADYYTRLYLPYVHQPRDEWMSDFIDVIQAFSLPSDELSAEKLASVERQEMPERLASLDPQGRMWPVLPCWEYQSTETTKETDPHEAGGSIRDRLAATQQRYHEHRREMDEAFRQGTWRTVAWKHDWSMRTELLTNDNHGSDGDWFRLTVYDPTAFSRDLSQAELLREQGRRATEDAWGGITWPSTWSPPPDKYPQEIDAAYFSQAAANLLLSVHDFLHGLRNVSNRELLANSPKSIELLTQPLTDQLSQRKKQFSEWTVPARYSDGQMSFSPPYHQTAQATLWYPAVRRASGIVLDCQTPDTKRVNLPRKNLEGAVTFFRGHVRPVEESVARVTRWELPGHQSTINVLPDESASASVMFVLDCSGSMGQRLGERTRMQLAKEALTDTLTQLKNIGRETGGPSSRIKTGLMAYGFRMKWVKEKEVPNALKNEFFPEQPVAMSKDVETLVPLRPIRDAFDDISTWVGRLSPSGFTPLYYSIRVALEQRPSQLIVITDGENSPQGLINAPLTEQDRADLKQITTIHVNTDIHVILFGSPEAQSRLEKDLNATGNPRVHIYYADNFLRLRNLLRVSLDLMEYQVNQNTTVALGTQATVEIGRPGEPQETSVAVLRPTEKGETTAVLQHHFPLEGDEELTFQLLGNGTGERQFVPLGEPPLSLPQEASGFQLGLTSELRQGTANFVATIRDPQPSTPRPQQIWAEIIPASSSLQSPVSPAYVFFDRTFQSHTHRPELQLRADAWPKQADQATVRAWLRSTHAKPSKVIRWQDLPFKLPGIALTSMVQAGSSRHCIVEEHHSDPSTVGRIRIDVTPAPSEVERRSYHSESPIRVRHEFTLPQGANPENVHITITTLESFQQDAVFVEWKDVPLKKQ